jgi:hypothetical protein
MMEAQCSSETSVASTANVVPSSLNLVILMMEALRSSKMSVLTRVIGRNIPEEGILHSHRREKNRISRLLSESVNIKT